VKLANSVVGDHGIGQFQEMANPVQQINYRDLVIEAEVS
jgi:hypothetical protein